VEIFTLSPAGFTKPPIRRRPSRRRLVERKADPMAATARRVMPASPQAARTIPEGRPDALPDYELLELLLFWAIPRQDVKPLAKRLIGHFGSFARGRASPADLNGPGAVGRLGRADEVIQPARCASARSR